MPPATTKRVLAAHARLRREPHSAYAASSNTATRMTAEAPISIQASVVMTSACGPCGCSADWIPGTVFNALAVLAFPVLRVVENGQPHALEVRAVAARFAEGAIGSGTQRRAARLAGLVARLPRDGGGLARLGGQLFVYRLLLDRHRACAFEVRELQQQPQRRAQQRRIDGFHEVTHGAGGDSRLLESRRGIGRAEGDGGAAVDGLQPGAELE